MDRLRTAVLAGTCVVVCAGCTGRISGAFASPDPEVFLTDSCQRTPVTDPNNMP